MTTPKLGRHLGRIPDRPDPRDKILPKMAHLGVGAPLPSHVDVFAGLRLPVYDQGNLGSCTANAGVLYRRFLAQKFARYSAPDQDLSRLFLYYQERKLYGPDAIGVDTGASIRDVVYVLESTGVCPAPDDPYNIAQFADPDVNDSAKDNADAVAYKIGAYHRILDVNGIRSCLASGYAAVLGFVVYESFENIGSNGVMPMPQSDEEELGGHAVVIRGYDDARRAFLIQNSWGPDWGAAGSFWMPYGFLDNQQLSQYDCWMGHLGEPW